MREREREKNIRNIRTTTAVPSLSPGVSRAVSSITSVATLSPPVEIKRQSSQRKYKSAAEANYLALRRNNNYKARQYSSTSTSPGISN